MLALTDRAVDVIKQVVQANDLPDGAGLRIATQVGAGTLGAALAEAPEVEDEIVEVEGARVFLDPIAHPQLDDMILDAELRPSGGVTFGVTPQAA
jgi:Fe-S cluster assembly iron-binding protein IscA